MASSNGEEQLVRLKKNNERLTILCIVFGAIAIGAGLYARIQASIAKENVLIAAIAVKRSAEAKQIAERSRVEAEQQRKIAASLNEQLAKMMKEKPRASK